MTSQKILIAVPVRDRCEPQMMESVFNLKIPYGCEVSMKTEQGYNVEQARNRLVRYSTENGYDLTFFVDSDIILPPDALSKLVFLNAPIATGWYIKKIPGQHIIELFHQGEDGGYANYQMLPENQIMPVDGCGFGCTLVRNSVFKAVGPNNWFVYQQKPQYTCSEDIDFCIKAKEKGIPIVADTSLHCGHVGQLVF